MLTRIKIENFKGIKYCEISDLGKVNVFVGRNNSGKSSILDALCLLRSAFNPMLFNEPVPNLLLRRKAIERSMYMLRNFWYNYETTQRIKFNLEFKSGEKLNIEVLFKNDSEFDILLEDPSGMMGRLIEGKYFGSAFIRLDGMILSQGNIQDIAKRYPHINTFLREIVIIDDYLARKLELLEMNVFNRIYEQRRDKRLAEKLNEVYNVEAETLTYIPISPIMQKFRLSVTTKDLYLHIDDMGDGTKYAMVILFLCSLLKDTAFLVEEVESHQHSGAITKFIPELVKIANQQNVQLFLTTHSIEVLNVLSQLSEEYDIHLFYIENKNGYIDVRHLGRNVDFKILLDLGVDPRFLEAYKKFIIVEGDSDIQFFKSLFKRYGKNIEELGYFVNAGSKDNVITVLMALLSTKKDVVVTMDYDNEDKKSLIQKLHNALKNRNYKIKNQEDNTLELEENLKITLIPMGLYNDGRLKQIGINKFEMEDYCLKLIDVDENLSKWAGLKLEELIDRAEKFAKAGFKINAYKSSSLIGVLASLKDMEPKNVIDYIISSANIQALEKVISDELKNFLRSEIKIKD
jgi:AAA15 family ATPase/GTPase/5S rRNA maturation endonuclease (ribonuclease M5)